MGVKYRTVFFGPFLGELGWECSRWRGFIQHWWEEQYPKANVIVASFPGRESLYRSLNAKFIPLPQWFLDKKYDVDSYESVDITPADYGKLLRYFKQFYNVGETREIRTPRGCNYILPALRNQKIIRLNASDSARELSDRVLKGNEEFILVSARGRSRGAARNWPERSWKKLITNIRSAYPNLAVVIVGNPSGSSLNGFEGEKIINLMDKVPGEIAIDVTIAFLERATTYITSQSGSTHLGLQTGCPSIVLGHEEKRHAVEENYLKTPCMFLETPNYNADPDIVFSHFKDFYSEMCKLLRKGKEG